MRLTRNEWDPSRKKNDVSFLTLIRSASPSDRYTQFVVRRNKTINANDFYGICLFVLHARLFGNRRKSLQFIIISTGYSDSNIIVNTVAKPKDFILVTLTLQDNVIGWHNIYAFRYRHSLIFVCIICVDWSQGCLSWTRLKSYQKHRHKIGMTEWKKRLMDVTATSKRRMEPSEKSHPGHNSDRPTRTTLNRLRVRAARRSKVLTPLTTIE